MTQLKTDFHLHTSDDRKDPIEHSAKELILYAANNGFSAIAITNHDTFTYSTDLANFGMDHGVLLIPGIEKTVEKKHVLILNAFPATEHIHTFKDLRAAKDDGVLLIAPHPFFKTGGCLEGKLYEHLDLFDAIEFSFFYSRWFNLNREAAKLSRAKGLPLIGNSDCHFLKYMGVCHSLINTADQSTEAVFAAIREKQVRVVSQPIALPKLALILCEMAASRRTKTPSRRAEPPVFAPSKEVQGAYAE